MLIPNIPFIFQNVEFEEHYQKVAESRFVRLFRPKTKTCGHYSKAAANFFYGVLHTSTSMVYCEVNFWPSQ